jgi:hypothetical protein
LKLIFIFSFPTPPALLYCSAMTKPRHKEAIRQAALLKAAELRPSLLAEPPPHDWRDDFLSALAHGSSTVAAARTAGISRHKAYNTRDRNEGFANAWDQAILEGRGRWFGWTRASMGLPSPRPTVQRFIRAVER